MPIVILDPDANSGKELEVIVEADIEAFAKFFCEKLGNDSLSKPERAILKTYLWWKTHQEPLSAQD